MKTPSKVLAYITRRRNGQQEVLVFAHRDFPEAGMQVPAGTVDEGEPLEAALWREIQEESGLKREQLWLVGKLAEDAGESSNRRHVFHLEAFMEHPDSWTHIVQGQGGDRGLVFQYRWAPLNIELAGGQHRWLGLIGTR